MAKGSQEVNQPIPSRPTTRTDIACGKTTTRYSSRLNCRHLSCVPLAASRQNRANHIWAVTKTSVIAKCARVAYAALHSAHYYTVKITYFSSARLLVKRENYTRACRKSAEETWPNTCSKAPVMPLAGSGTTEGYANTPFRMFSRMNFLGLRGNQNGDRPAYSSYTKHPYCQKSTDAP